MRHLLDTVWHRRGTSWIWDEEARNQVCNASDVWTLRQFLRTLGNWPEDLPSNESQTLVVAGLEGCLDLLTPGDAECWLGEEIKTAILSFQDGYGGEAALVFWLPSGDRRLKIHTATEAVTWVCDAPHRGSELEFGRILWGGSNEYQQLVFLPDSAKPAGLFHLRIT